MSRTLPKTALVCTACFFAVACFDVSHAQDTNPHPKPNSPKPTKTFEYFGQVNTGVWLDLQTSHCQTCHTASADLTNSLGAFSNYFVQDSALWTTDLHRSPLHLASPYLAKFGARVGHYQISLLLDPHFRSHLPIDQETVWLVNVVLPAEGKLDLNAGDVLVAMDSKPIENLASFRKTINEDLEASHTLQVIRKGKKQQLEISAKQLADPAKPFRIGVQAESPSEALRAQLGLYENEGLLVTNIFESSPASKAGIKKHDILLRAGSRRLSDVDGLKAALNLSQGEKISLFLMRGGKEQKVEVIPERDNTNNVF
ncbi:MAG: PDZ domain-containing protein, partial [Pirellulales bacterium]|nr:PDZ domain-containing protein [Pirellulales bacterium]